MANDETEKLVRKLAKAQLKLQAADERLAATRMEGEQAVQHARLEAEKALSKARRKVARRTDKVAALERALQGHVSDEEAGTITTPDQVVTVLERIEGAAEVHEDIPRI